MSRLDDVQAAHAHATESGVGHTAGNPACQLCMLHDAIPGLVAIARAAKAWRATLPEGQGPDVCFWPERDTLDEALRAFDAPAPAGRDPRGGGS